MSCSPLVSWRPFRSACANRRYQPYEMFCLGSISWRTWLLKDAARHRLKNTAVCSRGRLGRAVVLIDPRCASQMMTVETEGILWVHWLLWRPQDKPDTFSTHMQAMPLMDTFIQSNKCRHTVYFIMMGCSCYGAVSAMLKLREQHRDTNSKAFVLSWKCFVNIYVHFVYLCCRKVAYFLLITWG